MSFAANLPLFSIVACLICAALSSLLREKAAAWVTRILALAVAAAAAAVLVLALKTGQTTTYRMGHYPHPWGNELRFGILEPLFSGVFALVLLACTVGGSRELVRDISLSKRSLYYVMCDLLLATLLALLYTNDVFTGYVFIEICTIASCGILMIRRIGRTTLAAVRYMIFSLIGSGLFLIGVVFLYAQTGHLLMPNLKAAIAEIWASGQSRTPLMIAICLMTLGLCIKSGLFPFHYWMPDTYGYATPCSSGILSGLVSKGYIFLLIKLILNVFGRDVFYASGIQNVLYLLGVVGMVVGSVSAMRENDIFRMVAFSSAAQIGYIYMGIGLSPELGILASLFHILTHAITKPLLFLSASGLVTASGGDKRFRALLGAAHRNPGAGFAFAVGSLSMIGLPLTMGFIAKYLFAFAAFRENLRLVPTLLALAVSTVLNAYYFTRTLIRIFNTRDLQPTAPVRLRSQPHFALAAALLIGANLSLGILAQPLITLLRKGLAMVL